MTRRVTALTRQKRAGRVNVYLDGEFWLGVSEETLIRLGLYTGQELSPGEVERIETEAGGAGWLDRAMRFIAYRPRSEQEVRRKLLSLGASEAELERTLERLRELSLVDDAAFVEAYLRDRDAVRPLGPDRLRSELRAKGIEREVVEEVLAAREPEAELVQARRLAERDPLWQRRGEREVREKLYARLRRRGFGSGVISTVLAED